VSLAPPPKLRRLQEALYTKAKQESAYRLYLLYDKVYRADILAHAYALSKQHGGAPGVDGVTFEDIVVDHQKPRNSGQQTMEGTQPVA
jgi:RNA-directed DNA polymerase